MRCLVATLLLGVLLACVPLPAAEPNAVTVQVKDGAIEFRAGSNVVASYHTRSDVAKPYLWPLLAPGGIEATRAWPMEKGRAGETIDHVHQKSAWFCHGDVIPEGMTLTRL